MVKFVCCLLLHINMQPKILGAIDRLTYIMEHPDKFDDMVVPIVICLMKLMIEFYLEFMCLSLTSASEEVDNCVMDFVALGVISELDQRYFSSIRDPLKDRLGEINFRLPQRS